MWTFTRAPRWLSAALNLDTPAVPALIDEEVSPVIDIHQGGWQHAAYRAVRGSRGPSLGAADVVMVAQDTSLTRVVLEADVSRSGGAGTKAVYLAIWHPTVPADTILIYWNPAVAVGAQLTTVELLGGRGGLCVVPPGFVLGVGIPATAAGETFHYGVLFMDVAAGSKPV
jgi:hypothetical protein